MLLNSRTGTLFYLGICVRLDHLIDIRKGLWRSVFTILIPSVLGHIFTFRFVYD
ncbi:hypothetical protein E2C01_085375 [Portunus trituberculatus]|uniref:Uncharacterized protein n=1 Tax=Portunus trituberculatus TaxID=210409 RepID=A0A5B7IXP0_PORTR|nr:hypothetical protein [Portunus trituberculatus]